MKATSIFSLNGTKASIIVDFVETARTFHLALKGLLFNKYV